MKRILVLVFVSTFFALGSYAVGQDNKKQNADALDRIINEQQQKELGFTKLSTAEREKVAALLKNLLRVSSENSLERVAVQKMEENGWGKVKVLGTKRVGHSDWLIVEISPFSTWAIEPPFLAHFSPGYYWAKTSPFSGVNKMIDSSGVEHSFTFADKKELN